MLQTGSPMPANASALPHAACGDHRRSHPIRGKTAHKKIPKLANDRDTNVIGGGAAAGSAFDDENQSLPGARSLGGQRLREGESQKGPS